MTQEDIWPMWPNECRKGIDGKHEFERVMGNYFCKWCDYKRGDQ